MSFMMHYDLSSNLYVFNQFWYQQMLNPISLNLPEIFTFVPQVSNYSFCNPIPQKIQTENISSIQLQSSEQSQDKLLKKKGLNSRVHNCIGFLNLFKRQKFKAKKRKNTKRNLSQKDNRNVYSNLLRLLFKNVLEVQLYDAEIDFVINRYNLTITKKQFYSWLWSSKVNYKSYLKFSSVIGLFTGGAEDDRKIILRTVADKFLKDYCVSHALTSKRIEDQSVRMHLVGSRDLQKSIFGLEKK